MIKEKKELFNVEALKEMMERREEPLWLRRKRLEAWALYEDMDFPSQQSEEWRRTDLKAFPLEVVDPSLDGSTVDRQSEPWLNDGAGGAIATYNSALAHYGLKKDYEEKGVILTDLFSACDRYPELLQKYLMTNCVSPAESKFTALHGAFWNSGLFLYVPPDLEIELPIGALAEFGGKAAAFLHHTLIVVDKGSKVSFVEELRSEDSAEKGYASRCLEIILGEGAKLFYLYIQDFGDNIYNLAKEKAVLAKDSSLNWFNGIFGSTLMKTHIEAMVQEQGAEARMYGIFFPQMGQQFDIYNLLDHKAPCTTGDVLFKGAVARGGKSVFQGLIKIRKEAQQTETYLANYNLLLSEKAKADSIPRLEIEANNVRASHGVTIGRVEEEQLFYLMSRGLPRQEASRLIVEGFFEPLIGRVPMIKARDRLRALVANKMEQCYGSETNFEREA